MGELERENVRVIERDRERERERERERACVRERERENQTGSSGASTRGSPISCLALSMTWFGVWVWDLESGVEGLGFGV